MIGEPAPVPAIYAQADRFELARCRCPTCLRLDLRQPGQGFQLALFPYRPMPNSTRADRRRQRRELSQ